MRTYITIVGVVLLLAGSSFAKPLGPIKGQLMPAEATAAVGKTLEFTLTIETTMQFSAVSVELVLPPGVKLLKGSRAAEIRDFKPGEKRTFNYKVRVQKGGEQRIIATAKAKGLAPNEAFGGAFSAVINPRPVKDNPAVTTDSDGTKIIVTTIPPATK
jgi:hypothetical protein